MTSYAIYKWKCLDCGMTGNVIPAFKQEPPNEYEECGSSEIAYPYHEEPSPMDPIPEFEGSVEEQIKQLEKLLDLEGSSLRSIRICQKISDLMRNRGN